MHLAKQKAVDVFKRHNDDIVIGADTIVVKNNKLAEINPAIIFRDIIPEKVEIIGNNAFNNCKALEKVYCKPTTPPTLDNYPPFDGTSSKLKIYVPRESVEAYKADANWSQYASKIEGYDF